MHTFIATAENRTLRFESDYNRARFLDFLDYCQKENKKIKIEQAKNPVSDEMRGYYFAAVIPEVRKTCKEWANLTGDELHEVLKKQFHFFEAWNSKTKRIERFGRSVMSERSSTQKAMRFLEDISDYLAECGLTMPDPEEYKKFINSAPLKENDGENI